MASRAAVVSVTVEVAIILALVLLLTYPSTQTSSQSIFHLEFTKSGGIAGINEKLVIGADGTASFTSGAGSVRSQIGLAEFSELKDVINENLERVVPKIIPARAGAADFFSYELTVSAGQRTTKIQWVDDWAAEEKIPGELQTVQSTIEKVLRVLIVEATFTNVNSSHVDLACENAVGICGALSITIFTDKTTYKAGEQVRVFAIVRNTGPPSIRYASPTPCDPDVRIVVSGASRTQDVTFSDLPEIVCIQVIQQRSLESNRFLTHSASWNLILDQGGPRVDAAPGTYFISARFPLANFEPELLQVSVPISVMA